MSYYILLMIDTLKFNSNYLLSGQNKKLLTDLRLRE